MSPAGEGGGRGEAAATGGSAGGEGAAAAASDVELVAGRSPAVGPVGPAPDNGVSTTAGDRLVVPALEGGRDSDESEEAGRWDEVAPVRPLPKRGPGVYGVLVLLLLLLLLGRLAASVPYTMLSYSAPTAAKSMLQRGCCASVATDDEAPSWSCAVQMEHGGTGFSLGSGSTTCPRGLSVLHVDPVPCGRNIARQGARRGRRTCNPFLLPSEPRHKQKAGQCPFDLDSWPSLSLNSCLSPLVLKLLSIPLPSLDAADTETTRYPLPRVGAVPAGARTRPVGSPGWRRSASLLSTAVPGGQRRPVGSGPGPWGWVGAPLQRAGTPAGQQLLLTTVTRECVTVRSGEWW